MATLHDAQLDENRNGESAELEEEVRRLRALVCELLCDNQQLRFQIAQYAMLTGKPTAAN
jgi:hypothetical protein